jgi:putative transposase
VIRLAVLMYVRFGPSRGSVGDLLFERSIGICHETARMWRKRFGPLFAGDIRLQRVSRMRGFATGTGTLIDESEVGRCSGSVE